MTDWFIWFDDLLYVKPCKSIKCSWCRLMAIRRGFEKLDSCRHLVLKCVQGWCCTSFCSRTLLHTQLSLPGHCIGLTNLNLHHTSQKTFSHIRTRLWSSMSTTGPPDKVSVYNGKGPKWVTKRCTHTHMQHPKLPSVFNSSYITTINHDWLSMTSSFLVFLVSPPVYI